MSCTVKAITARVPHLCDDCHWTPSLRGQPTIFPGHRYLRHTAFPGDEVNTSERPYSLDQCVACVDRMRPGAATLEAGACGQLCCDELPCALPLRHGADHSCRRCAVSPAGPGTAPPAPSPP